MIEMFIDREKIGEKLGPQRKGAEPPSFLKDLCNFSVL